VFTTKMITQMESQSQSPVLSTSVPGLFLVPDFLTPQEELELISHIDQGKWEASPSGGRYGADVQILGPRLDAHWRVEKDSPTTPHPAYSQILMDKIVSFCDKYFSTLNVRDMKLGEEKYTQVFINSYNKEAELEAHFDNRKTYHDVIFGVSLLSDTKLTFTRRTRKKREENISIPRRSIYVMSGDSRLKWKHSMKKGAIEGERRVSLTYRMIQEFQEKQEVVF